MQLSLIETNSFLQRAGLNLLDENSFETAFSTLPANRLISALQKANKDVGAKRWLMNNLEGLLKINKTAQEEKTQQPVQRQPNTASAPQKKTPAHPPVNNQATNSNAPSPEDDLQKKKVREFEGHHVYGSKAALYFSCDVTRSGHHTLRLEGAYAVSKNVYLWNEKIAVQMTSVELPMVAAVLFGFVNQCEFKNHGSGNNKGFKLILQDNPKGKSMFVNVMEANKPIVAVPVSPEDIFYIRNLLLSQMMKNNPMLDSAGLISSIRCYASMKKTTA